LIFPEHFAFLIMTPELMISALAQGKTGNEILAILESVTGTQEQQQQYRVAVGTSRNAIADLPVPTLEEIAF
jgi:hypothetical protein